MYVLGVYIMNMLHLYVIYYTHVKGMYILCHSETRFVYVYIICAKYSNKFPMVILPLSFYTPHNTGGADHHRDAQGDVPAYERHGRSLTGMLIV